MNIFDMYQQMQGQQQSPFAMGQGGGLGQGQDMGLGGPQGSLWEPDILAHNIEEPPQMPSGPGDGQSDVSGFANYGMTAPPLKDTGSQIQNLMKMAMTQAPQQQRAAPQQGAIMQYLQQLGMGG